MGFFAYIYYHTFIAVYKVKLGSVIESAINGLTPDEQIELVKGMTRYLTNQGVVSHNVCEPKTERFYTNANLLQLLDCIDQAALNSSS